MTITVDYIYPGLKTKTGQTRDLPICRWHSNLIGRYDSNWNRIGRIYLITFHDGPTEYESNRAFSNQ